MLTNALYLGNRSVNNVVSSSKGDTMKKLFALTCLSVLLLAPACCRRPCAPCVPEPLCEPVDQLAGSDQCVEICPPQPECRDICPPTVECVEEEVPVRCFRKRKVCKTTQVGPMEFSCDEVDVIKPREEGMDGAAVSTMEGVKIYGQEQDGRRGRMGRRRRKGMSSESLQKKADVVKPRKKMMEVDQEA